MNFDIFQAVISFAAPCWIANMLFSFIIPLKRMVPWMAKIDRPIDHGFRLLGERIFGDSRNYAGLATATILALIWGLVSYDLLIGLKIILTFIGTLFGSFIKRRLKLGSGQRLIVLDQLDYMFVVGGVWYSVGLERGDIILLAMLITLIAQPIVSYFGHLIHLKDKPY